MAEAQRPYIRKTRPLIPKVIVTGRGFWSGMRQRNTLPFREQRGGILR